jgi:hypothetical protein
MRTYIKKLQSKPESTRKQIFFGSLIVCMSFVSLVWVGSLGYKFSKNAEVKTENEIKPFALFGQSISDTYKNVTASVGNVSFPKEEVEQNKEIIKNEKVIDLIPVENQ